MPPKGWKKADQPVRAGSRMMEPTRWAAKFVPFGDRLNFLSSERQHLVTGRLRILPAKHPDRRRDEG